MLFDGYIAIDWSGDKQNFQKGVQVALLDSNNARLKIIRPSNGNVYWSRYQVIDWIKSKIKFGKFLIGIDFAFSYPYYDFNSYFPGLINSPRHVKDLWELIDKLNLNENNFYGGNIWYNDLYKQYYNSHVQKGDKFFSRRRLTEKYAKKIYSPSPTFNCVGPGAVGTGTLAGMRVLNYLKNLVTIWPFDNNFKKDKSVIVEIFPSLYFRKHKIKPKPKVGYILDDLNNAFKLYGINITLNKFEIRGPDQDEIDALVSCAALKFFSENNFTWNVPNEADYEGWIFGV